MKRPLNIRSLLTVLTVYSCSAPRHVSQLVRDIHKDTVYLKDVSIEYRYKMIHDTVKVVQRDSIPYEVTVVQTKEIVRPQTAYEKASRFCFWLVITAVLVIVSKLAFKLKSHFRL